MQLPRATKTGHTFIAAEIARVTLAAASLPVACGSVPQGGGAEGAADALAASITAP